MALTLNNKLKGLKIGDYFWCKYVAPTTNVLGTFSDLGKKLDSDVSSSILSTTTPSPTSNGYFKFIVVDIKNGKYICLADRNIQANTTWDSINNDGYASGKQIKIDNNNESIIRYTIKLPTGGTASGDTNNDWDKYIVNSTLNSNISAGDNNIWNWSGLYSHTSTSISTNTSRTLRGNGTVSTFTSTTTSANSNYRPMLIIEKIFTNKSFILFNGEYKKAVSQQTTTITGMSTTNAIPTMTSNTTPSGVASGSSSVNATYDYYKVFDKNTANNDGWCTPSGVTSGWIQYQFTSPIIIGQYTLTTDSYPTYMPKNWTFEGSVDGVNYTVLDTQTNIAFATNEKKVFSIPNTTFYSYYRLNITSNNGASQLQINEIEMIPKNTTTSTSVVLSTVNTSLPNKAQFLSDGVSDLSIFDRKITTLPLIDMGTSTTLGSGKQFDLKVDLKKYFDIRGINIK
jgi:hypothetical protein